MIIPMTTGPNTNGTISFIGSGTIAHVDATRSIIIFTKWRSWE